MSDAKADHIRWNLNSLYKGVDDPQLDTDVSAVALGMKQFADEYRGKLDSLLSSAIERLGNISMLSSKVNAFLFFKLSLNTGDSAAKAKSAEVERILADASALLEFFDIEVAALSVEQIEAQMRHDSFLARHRPYIDYIRIKKPHQLSEQVEVALTKRSPFGEGAWGEFFDELASDLEFEFKDKKQTLTEMLHLLTESQDSDVRAEAMKAINDGFAGPFAKYSAQTLYMVTGADAVERRERNYTHPMQGRNMSNRVPDSVVDALHKATRDKSAPLAQRYYKLKAAHLGMKTLRWSDRNAQMPFKDSTAVPFDEGMQMVLSAYESFSPTLAQLIRETVEAKHVDAPAQKGKRGGAFNYSIVLPGNVPVSYTLLNYLGTGRDVATLAHELGHGVHGLLAGHEQGVLMFHPPMAYAETASVFGEQVTFDSLRQRLIEKGDTKSLLALTMGKIDDIINTTVRQISFSCFEQQLHGRDATYSKWGAPKKLSVEEISAIWLSVTKEFYGPEGGVFTYENMDKLWAYISHFHNPFYVYSYAYGQCQTDALYAVKDQFGDKFEPLYLDLLRAGSTKNASEMLAPFGLDPSTSDFWEKGIEAGLGSLVTEAERLSKEMGVGV